MVFMRAKIVALTTQIQPRNRGMVQERAKANSLVLEGATFMWIAFKIANANQVVRPLPNQMRSSKQCPRMKLGKKLNAVIFRSNTHLTKPKLMGS